MQEMVSVDESRKGEKICWQGHQWGADFPEKDDRARGRAEASGQVPKASACVSRWGGGKNALFKNVFLQTFLSSVLRCAGSPVSPEVANRSGAGGGALLSAARRGRRRLQPKSDSREGSGKQSGRRSGIAGRPLPSEFFQRHVGPEPSEGWFVCELPFCISFLINSLARCLRTTDVYSLSAGGQKSNI